ncbi:unnamed protein product [Peniophora sp. CBMAI 1063]|nr:unnamed protein product [Peniophora sp. CBMAI 1063]
MPARSLKSASTHGTLSGTLSAESSFRWDSESMPLPTSTASFLPSRDTRDHYDNILKNAFDGADKDILAHHRRVKELDKRHVTPSRMNKIMDCGHIYDPVHHAAPLWEEFDRAQAAILEIDGRGLGLLSGSFEGAEDWFGGRIQIIRSYAFARELGSRRLLVLKTAPPPPVDATQKRKHYEPPLELFARKFVGLRAGSYDNAGYGRRTAAALLEVHQEAQPFGA